MVTLRAAELADAPILAELWTDVLRRADRQDQIADLEIVIKGGAASTEQRVVVAEYDGQVAGAILVRVATLTALNLEPTVQAISPHVFPQFRRRGVGQALMEYAVAFAEEVGIGQIATAAGSAARDANRFMARLGLGAHAVLRIAPTHAVRTKLAAQHPVVAAGGGREITRVLAARRSMKRARTGVR
jgi:GNAT superfamily N-acetyltransferase